MNKILCSVIAMLLLSHSSAEAMLTRTFRTAQKKIVQSHSLTKQQLPNAMSKRRAISSITVNNSITHYKTLLKNKFSSLQDNPELQQLIKYEKQALALSVYLVLLGYSALYVGASEDIFCGLLLSTCASMLGGTRGGWAISKLMGISKIRTEFNNIKNQYKKELISGYSISEDVAEDLAEYIISKRTILGSKPILIKRLQELGVPENDSQEIIKNAYTQLTEIENNSSDGGRALYNDYISRVNDIEEEAGNLQVLFAISYEEAREIVERFHISNTQVDNAINRVLLQSLLQKHGIDLAELKHN